MRLVLAGAGVGGLTAALALDPGLQVTVLEQAPDLGEAGAGVQLSPNATRVLIGLGLGEALAGVGFEPQAAEVRDAGSGRLLLRQPLGAFARERWGAPYLHLHRSDLQALLLRATQDRGNVALRLGARLEALEPASNGVSLRLGGGETIGADAVVGCDGLRSAVRASLFGPDQPRFTGQVAWRGVVETARLPAGLIAPVAAVWTGPGRHFVHYYVRGGSLVNFVGVVAGPWREESWTQRGDKADLARAFAGWPEPVQGLIEHAGEVWRWALFDRPPAASWTRGRVSLLGDAAHPMPPFLAQGAAMAVEDAAALARRLTPDGAIEPALSGYEAERRPRTSRVQAMSRRNAGLFHLPGPVARGLFAAATTLDRLDESGGARRFDWLYGYKGASG